MLSKKKIGALSTILLATLIIGVYAGMQLSNTLIAHWKVINTGQELRLSWNNSPDGWEFARGVWYGDGNGNFGVRLENLGEATYNVIVKFQINADQDMPTDCFDIQYWDGAAWLDLPITGWGDTSVEGTFGPPTGFTVGHPYDVTTYLRVMFDGLAPITDYYVWIWVVQM